ncbi:hypothetical protein SMNI109538_20240 [Smaragdicoccus niigatensis]
MRRSETARAQTERPAFAGINTQPVGIPRLYTPAALVDMGIAPSEQALAQMRHRGIGPAFLKLSNSRSGRIVYEESAVLDYLASCRRQRTG